MRAVLTKHKTGLVLLLGVILAGIVYVSLTLTPSHYGVILKDHFGLDYKPLVGQAQPIRGDEYSVVTPYFQIAVNNNFQRFNQTSPYGEDLRNFVGLPLQDWALVFKPYMWGFWVMDAARAFSLYHYFMIAAFLIGFTLFLNRLKLPLLYSVLIAGILFFSHHNQVWWSSNAPVLGLTVWILLPFLYKWSYPVKFLATFYLATMAILALIYPAWQISQVYVLGLLALAFRRDSFRFSNLVACGLGFLCACGLSYYYLKDIIPLMQNTVYPGNVAFSGGGAAKHYLWAQFAPHALITTEFNPIFFSARSNICEVGTVASLLLTFILSFSDYRWWIIRLKTYIWQCVVCVIGLSIILSWMFLPISADIGQFLLLDQVKSHRLVLAFGTFVVLLSAISVFYSKWVFSWLRMLVYCVFTLLAPYVIYTKQNNPVKMLGPFDGYDIAAITIVLLLVIAKLFANNLSKDIKKFAYYFAAIALVYNIVSFSHFNPMQQASDIFSQDIKTKVEALKSELTLSNENLAAYEGTKAVSAALSGIGLPTLHHAFMSPEQEFFEKKYPDLPAQKSNRLFNRFAKVGTVESFVVPELIAADLIGLPAKSAATSIQLELIEHDISNSSKKAYVEAFAWSERVDNKRLLRVDFYSQDILDVNAVVALVSLSKTLQRRIESKEVILDTALIAKPNLTKLLSLDSSVHETLEANTIWQLYLEFSSERVGVLNTLDKNVQSIKIKNLQDSILLYPTKNLEVEKVSKNFLTVADIASTVHGNVDTLRYNSDTNALTVLGWAPVEDVPTARWIGYFSPDTSLKLKAVNVHTREDVPLSFGAYVDKGFELIFDAPNFDESVALPLCLYAVTDAFGLFPINAKGQNMSCLFTNAVSDSGIIEELDEVLDVQSLQGTIDALTFDKENNRISIVGWAPRNQLNDIENSERWFGYLSEVEVENFTIKSVSRPDVVKAFGDAYIMSGFEINLEITNTTNLSSPLNFCFYGRNNQLGVFHIPSSNNDTVIRCEQ